MSIGRQRISKHTFLTTETLFSVGSVQSGYKEVFGSLEGIGSEESIIGKPVRQDMSLGAEELNRVESSELAVAE
jgi:hypothetical protein